MGRSAPADCSHPQWRLNQSTSIQRRSQNLRGLSIKLLQAVVDFARARGAKIVEGYPHETKKTTADVFVYTGLVSAFRKAGFEEVARRSKTRPIMRLSV